VGAAYIRRSNSTGPALLDHMPQFLEDLAAYVGKVRAGHEAAPSNR